MTKHRDATKHKESKAESTNQIELAPIGNLEDVIFGMGMNCITGNVAMASCVTGWKKQSPSNAYNDSVHVQVVKDSSSYSNLMSVAASASASGLTWSASASVSYLSQQTGSDTYVSYVALRDSRSQTIYADFSNATISADAVNYLTANGASAFVGKYGTHCVIGVAYGGSFAGRIRFEAHSASDKESIAATMSGSISAFGGGGSVDAAFNSETSSVNVQYTLTADAQVVGFTLSGFSSVDPDGMVKACTNLTYEHDGTRGVDGNPAAFVCQTWDQFPAIQNALSAMGQPNALNFSDAQANLLTLATEYAALEYIIGTAGSLIRSGSYLLPSYSGVLSNMITAANNGQNNIQALTLEQIASLNPQTMAPYIISSQMTQLLSAISHGQVLLQVAYAVDGAFENGGSFSAPYTTVYSNSETQVAQFVHSRSQGDDPPQMITFFFHVGQDSQGSYLTTHLNWQDPYGPGSGDWYGQRVDIGESSFPTAISNAQWTPFPWNEISAQVVGFNENALFGRR